MKRIIVRARRTFLQQLEPRFLLSQYGLLSGYGEHGVAVASFPGGGMFQEQLIVQSSDQSTLIAGPMSFANASTGHVVAAKFDAQGQLIDQWTSSLDLRAVTALVLQPDGKIVVAGMTLDATDVVARFTTSGALDATFAGDGVLELNFDVYPEFFESTALALDAQGRILLVGSIGRQIAPPQNQWLLMRLTSSGTFDRAFDQDGVLRMDGNPPQQVGSQPGGKIIVLDPTGLRRFTTAGVLDPTFGESGVASFPQLQTFGRSITVMSDGRILLNAMDKLARISVNGSLDTSFGDNGIATVLQGLPPQTPKSFVSRDGSITVIDVFGVSRLTANGQPDPDFGISGRINNYVDQGRETLTGIVPQAGANFALASDGDVLMSGYCNDPGARVARFHAQPSVFLDATGVLSITGTDSADSIVVTEASGRVRVSFDGVVQTFALADVRSVDVLGGEGNNSIRVSLAMPVLVSSGAGDDVIETGDGADTIAAGDGDDSIVANGGNDAITAGDGLNTVRGGAGHDRITGGAQADSIDAGDGNDSFANEMPQAGPAGDTIDCGSGNDIVSDHGTVPMLILAGAGNDVMDLGSGGDTIYAGDGDDLISAGDGNNLVFGGSGNDTVRCGNGRDTLWGEIGYDWLRGGGGDDLMNGGAGKDRMWGQEGDDRMYGRNNNDNMDGGEGDDRLLGGQGIDKFVGGEGNDRLYACDHDAETLDGGNGDDSCAWDDSLDVLLNLEHAR